jgi:hypothetical protein
MHIDERVRAVAQAILNGLGGHAPSWTVLSVTEPDVPPGQWSVHTLLVTLGRSPDETVGAYYSLAVPEPDAIAALASQIQDHAIEATQGDPLPPCPGHPHPLSAHVVDGVAVWECPRDSRTPPNPIV